MDGRNRQTARRRASRLILRGGLRNEGSRGQMETHAAKSTLILPVSSPRNPQLNLPITYAIQVLTVTQQSNRYPRISIFVLQYLRVGLVVLGEVGGGVGVVRGGGCSHRAVGEWGSALRDHRSHWGPVDPGARLSSLRLVSHRVWWETNKRRSVWVQMYRSLCKGGVLLDFFHILLRQPQSPSGSRPIQSQI